MTGHHDRSADIVDRLRDRDAMVIGGMFHAIPALREAADEIERLRERNRLQAQDIMTLGQEVGRLGGVQQPAKPYALNLAEEEALIRTIETQSERIKELEADLAAQPPAAPVEIIPETCPDCGVREPCDEDCPNHVEPEPVTNDRETRTGAYLLQMAKSLGWPDDGEGALEFMLRRAREVAFEDCGVSRCSAGNVGVAKAAIAQNYQPLKAAKEPALAEGCCSATRPCSHQKADPGSVCDTCQAAHGGAQ